MKKVFMNIRVIIMLIFLLFAVLSIHPSVDVEGVAIRSVEKNSSAADAGLRGPDPKVSLMQRERIIAIDGIPVNSVDEFYDIVSEAKAGQTLMMRSSKETSYAVEIQPLIERTELNETELKEFEEEYKVNVTVDGTTEEVVRVRNVTREVPKVIEKVIGIRPIGMKVYEAPTTNLKKGLDLEGGTRVLLQPETEVSQEDMDTLIDGMKERLNVFGLSDIVVRESKDLAGDQYITVEIAGATEAEVRDLLAKQGKFESKIGGKTVFTGGQDITYVCRSAECSGIDYRRGGCGRIEGGVMCRFFFQISLSPEAAQKQADVTKTLEIVTQSPEGQPLARDDQILNESIELFLDDSLVDTLTIGAELRGNADATDIQISGSGVGLTEGEAVTDALANMKRLQTILITGSLPVKLDIAKADTISPTLGKVFLDNAILVGLIAILVVIGVVYLRYKRFAVALPLAVTMVSEVVLILGFAALVRWNLDLAAIGGILIAVGTGVDHQIVIADETIRGESSGRSWKQRVKQAFSIIMGSYFTTMVSMIPLLFAGAGLLRGFAFTTMMGISFGVFITRPAFAAMIEILLKK